MTLEHGAAQAAPSITELAQTIGKTGLWEPTISLHSSRPEQAASAAILVRVRIRDARYRFGVVDYLVEPADGSGQRWVTADRVELDS